MNILHTLSTINNYLYLKSSDYIMHTYRLNTVQRAAQLSTFKNVGNQIIKSMSPLLSSHTFKCRF